MWKFITNSFLFKKFTWLLNSFSIKDNGASARKLSGFFSIVVMGGLITSKHTTDTNAPTMLTIWLIAGGFFLGLVTVAEIIKLKDGDKDKITPPDQPQ